MHGVADQSQLIGYMLGLAVNESAIYGHSIQFNQEFACKAISELGIDQYQNYNNNVPHWQLKNIFAVLYVSFSVLALQPCINFKVFYIIMYINESRSQSVSTRPTSL